MFEIAVTHATSTGHRIPGHEDGRGKCARLHGHTYIFDVALSGPMLDAVGFIADFGAVKRILDEWDHRLVLWEGDTILLAGAPGDREQVEADAGIVRVPFIPTAENMADWLADRFVADLAGVETARVTVRESEKTSATVTRHRP